MRKGFHTAAAVVKELRTRKANDAPILQDCSPPRRAVAQFVISLIKPFTRALGEIATGSNVGVGIKDEPRVGRQDQRDHGNTMMRTTNFDPDRQLQLVTKVLCEEFLRSLAGARARHHMTARQKPPPETFVDPGSVGVSSSEEHRLSACPIKFISSLTADRRAQALTSMRRRRSNLTQRGDAWITSVDRQPATRHNVAVYSGEKQNVTVGISLTAREDWSTPRETEAKYALPEVCQVINQRLSDWHVVSFELVFVC